MQVHRRAKLDPAGRLALCQAIESGMSLRQAAACLSVSPATAHRWWHRYRAASSTKRLSLAWRTDPADLTARRDCATTLQEHVCEVRRHTGWGPRLVAGEVGLAHSTVWKVLHRHGLARAASTTRDTTALRMALSWRSVAHGHRPPCALRAARPSRHGRSLPAQSSLDGR